jgi:hypothetical protein
MDGHQATGNWQRKTFTLFLELVQEIKNLLPV